MDTIEQALMRFDPGSTAFICSGLLILTVLTLLHWIDTAEPLDEPLNWNDDDLGDDD